MRLFLYGIALGSVLLVGCNDSSSPKTQASDSFTDQTARTISLPEPQAELLEPVDIQQVVATSPEDTEPVAVNF